MSPEFSTINFKEVLGIPQRGIIFSDLDGVWFDEKNNFKPPEIIWTLSIKQAQTAGYWVVLTSDTAPATLAGFAKDLGASPWGIAENGAVIYLPDVEYPYCRSSKINTLKSIIQTTLAAQTPDAYIWQGDATVFVQSNKQLSDAKPGQTVYLINTARIASLGIYTRLVSENGRLIVDDTQTQIVEKLINNTLASGNMQNDLRCKRYLFLGSCLIKNPSIIKSDAVAIVLREFKNTSLSYWMIGDTINDSMAAIENVRIAAVGNADDALKQEAVSQGGLVSDKPIAQGADDCIKQIIQKEAI